MRRNIKVSGKILTLIATLALTSNAIASSSELSNKPASPIVATPKIQININNLNYASSLLIAKSASIKADFLTSMQAYERALALKPNAKEVRNTLLLQYILNGKLDKAALIAPKSVQQIETKYWARLVLAINNLKKHNNQIALSYLNKDKSYTPIENLTVDIVKAWVNVNAGYKSVAVHLLEPYLKEEWSAFFAASQLFYIGLRTSDDALVNQAKASLKTHLDVSNIQSYARLIADQAILLAHKNQTKLALSLLDDPTINIYFFVNETRKLLANRRFKLITPSVTAEQALNEFFVMTGDLLADLRLEFIPVLYLQTALFLQPNSDITKIILSSRLETLQTPNVDKNILYEKALSLLNSISDLSIYRSDKQVAQIINLKKLHRYDEAIKIVDKLLFENPKSNEIVLLQASLYMDKADYKKVISITDKQLRFYKTGKQAPWQLYYYRAVAKQALSDFAASAIDFEQALAINPTNYIILNDYAMLLADTNQKLDKAKELASKALKLSPNNPMVFDTLGWVYYKLKNYDQAIKILQDALSIGAENNEVRFHLGQAYLAAGEHHNAIYQLKQAATDTDPKTPLYQMIMQSLKLAEKAAEADDAAKNSEAGNPAKTSENGNAARVSGAGNAAKMSGAGGSNAPHN